MLSSTDLPQLAKYGVFIAFYLDVCAFQIRRGCANEAVKK